MRVINMFENLTNKFEEVFSSLKKAPSLDENQVDEGLRGIRQALLEADVSLEVAKDFIEKVKPKALGQEIIRSTSPGDMVVKIVYDELVNLLGEKNNDVNLNAVPPVPMMLVGLQGSGKTTTTAKLARYLENTKKKKVMMVSLDIYRPAAQEQLKSLGEQNNILTLPIIEGQQPADICQRAISAANLNGADIILFDRLGDLFELYALADIAIVAGSITYTKGHNFIEPIHAGTLCITGTKLSNFQKLNELLCINGPIETFSTVEELRKDLTLKLSTVLKDPQIDVSITEYNSQKIIVSGVFESPGSYSIETVPKTLAQVVSTANPIQNIYSDYERGDLTSLKLTRDGSIYDIDYEYLSRNSQLLNNIYLKNGDVIHLSDSSLMNVFVLGEAQEPKTIRINRRNLPLSSVLGQAKGLDNAYSKNSSVYIFRPSDAENQPRIFRIDMTSPSGYLLADKFEVHSRDIVYIGTKNVTNWSRIFRQLIPFTTVINSVENI